jgi:hypothetical protein
MFYTYLYHEFLYFFLYKLSESCLAPRIARITFVLLDGGRSRQDVYTQVGMHASVFYVSTASRSESEMQ